MIQHDTVEQYIASLEKRLSFDELRKANVQRCEESYFPLDHWTPTDWACALAGEVGEACNQVKKLHRIKDVVTQAAELERAQYRVNIGKELADTIVYADLLAARLGIDLGEAVRQKFNEVSDRFESKVKL